MKALIVCFLFPLITSASEGGPLTLTSENTLIKTSFQLPEGRGTVHVVARNDGEAMGREILIEIRPQCGAAKLAVEQVPVATVKSTCAIDAKSLRYDSKKQNIRVLIFEPDASDYNRQTRVNPLTAKIQCLKKPKAHYIHVGDFCR